MVIVFFMQDTGAVFGAERATLDLACALQKTGVTPHFFLLEESRMDAGPSGLRDEIEVSGFPVHAFPVSGRLSLRAAKSIKQRFKEIGADVLHVIGYKANLHAQLSGVTPIAATVHGWLFRRDVKERLYDAVDRWCLKKCAAVICLSTYYRDLLLKCGVRNDRLHLIPSGLAAIPSDDDFKQVPAGKGLVFGMMGRFSDEKNHALFLDAAADLYKEYPEVTFRIAGQGPLESKLKKKCSDLGLSGAVDFCGYSDVAQFMKSIHVYVICSKIENLPYSILEAMAWGRPVIGTIAGGIPDLVEHGKTGILVESNNREALYQAMSQMIALADNPSALGRSGRERVQKIFTLEKSAALHQDVYQSLLKRG